MHIKTLFAGNKNQNHTPCGECQTSCQSACKTSCTVANQNCERLDLFTSKPTHEKPHVRHSETIAKVIGA